ncbi:hypothetical protein H2248_007646 [Termitomyces sp. 'cryptogamus']|nr:hypothetical protein H2248_007646 [Termitomyces sp. 'cryptogamus']
MVLAPVAGVGDGEKVEGIPADIGRGRGLDARGCVEEGEDVVDDGEGGKHVTPALDPRLFQITSWESSWSLTVAVWWALCQLSEPCAVLSAACACCSALDTPASMRGSSDNHPTPTLPNASALPSAITVFLPDGRGRRVKRTTMCRWEEPDWRVVVHCKDEKKDILSRRDLNSRSSDLRV